MQKILQLDWPAWIGTLLLIIIFREVAVWVSVQLNYPELGNLLGLISLLVVLIIWRCCKGLPDRLIQTTNRAMKESGFAFLPVCAGSLVMLVQMGAEIPLFLVVLTISTLLPLWLYAKMAKKWL